MYNIINLKLNEMEAKVKYQIATYSGETTVNCEEWDDSQTIINKAKAKLNRLYGPLPFGYESWKVVEVN